MGKITEEELKKITELRQENSQIIYTLGEVQYQKVNLEATEELIKIKIEEFKQKEADFLNGLKEKYGNVTINIETGEF